MSIISTEVMEKGDIFRITWDDEHISRFVMASPSKFKHVFHHENLNAKQKLVKYAFPSF